MDLLRCDSPTKAAKGIGFAFDFDFAFSGCKLGALMVRARG